MAANVRIALLTLLALMAFARSSAAAFCPGDFWGGRASSISDLGQGNALIGAQTSLTHTGFPQHRGVPPESYCAGNFYAKAVLIGIDATCTSSDTSTHHNEYGSGLTVWASRNCGGLSCGFSYHGGGVHWGFDQETEYTESQGSVNQDCPIDGDGDGVPEGEDCDDNNPDATYECCNGYDQEIQWCNAGESTWWDYDNCQCVTSPILIDLLGNGFALTGVSNGVNFDLDGKGVSRRISWTAKGSDDAWLVLDRNQNGTVDNASELFGNATPQPASSNRNGFAALAVFDENADGWIDHMDTGYDHLALWTDVNHDGVSQSDELRALSSAGVLRLSLDVKLSQRTDRFGNRYRYRAKIVTTRARDAGPYAYDLILRVAR